MELEEATPAVPTTVASSPRARHVRPASAAGTAASAVSDRSTAGNSRAPARGVRSPTPFRWATGLGKSVVIATLPKLLSCGPGDVTVVVAHRDELIEQLVDKFRVENPEAIIGIEKAERRASEECSIVVAPSRRWPQRRLDEFRRPLPAPHLAVRDRRSASRRPPRRNRAIASDAVLAQRPKR